MISVTQLRLNNTLLHNGQWGRVVQLTHEGVMLEYDGGSLSALLAEEDLKGLPLTPELLMSAGFKYTGETNAYQFILNEDAVITVNPHIKGGYSIQLCIRGKWCGKPIGTLHELQNIYIDLTGEELDVD